MIGRLPIALLMIVGAAAQSGQRDRYFTRYPFEKWKTENARPAIKWTEHILPARLSAHQRLVTRFEIGLDTHEIEKRRGRGDIIVLIEIQDALGRQWRTHQTFDLRRIPKDGKANGFVFSLESFIVPGDYQVWMAVCDSATLEHGMKQKRLHVAPLRSDPLPEAWRDLPAVEFVRAFETPEAWFQPYVRGRLHLPLPTSRPVHIQVVMNMTPSERVSGSIRVFRRNMSVLVPALKVLAGIEPPKGSVDVTLLDLTRRRTWEQRRVRSLDWMRMREPFADANPGVVDVQSLAAKAEMRQFFWDQVLERARVDERDDSLRVLIVLSAPVFLEHQIAVEPSRLPKNPNRRVFYLCYRPLSAYRPPVQASDGPTVPIATAMASDDLEHTLKPLDARVFSAATPEQVRKAIATMFAEIARM